MNPPPFIDYRAMPGPSPSIPGRELPVPGTQYNTITTSTVVESVP